MPRSPSLPALKAGVNCSVTECGNPIKARGLCNAHYLRFRKTGTLNALQRGMYGFKKGAENYACTPDARQRLSERRKGAVTAEKTKRKIRASMKRRLKEPELREKWRRNQLGRKHSIETIKKIQATKAKRPKKRSVLMHEADASYSRYVRTESAEFNGYVACFTCGVMHPIGEMDCGHFVSRRHMGTRFMPENTEPQCRACNRFNEGRKDVFSLRLVQKYGPDILERLHRARNQETHLSDQDLIEIRDLYKAKLKALGRS